MVRRSLRRRSGSRSDESMRRYLEEVKAALVADGFHDTFAQWPRRSQAFGLVKDFPGHRQMHVRAFWDGRLEAEIEFSRLCVNHWVSPRDPAHQELVVLLDNLGVGTHGVNHHYRPMTGQKKNWPDACLDHRVKRAFGKSLTLTRLLVLAVREEGIRQGVRAVRNGSRATADAAESIGLRLSAASGLAADAVEAVTNGVAAAASEVASAVATPGDSRPTASPVVELEE